jgi:iron complex transport system substrate-binding protein
MKKILMALILIAISSLVASAANKGTFAVKGEKIYSPTMQGSFLVYIMAPDRLAGWSAALKKHEMDYLPKKYSDLPIFGGWEYGKPVDKDLIKIHNIKKAVVILNSGKPEPRIKELESMGLDVLVLYASTTDDYIDLYRKLGKQMGLESRGNQIADFGKEMLDKTRKMVEDIPDFAQKRVYVGHGNDGLNALCYFDPLEIVNAKNLFECSDGAVRLTIDQIKLMNPEFIIQINPAMEYNEWRNLITYSEGRFHKPPYGPLGWLHHLTPYTSFIGVPWLACELYPDKCTFDIEKEGRRYYKLFFGMELTDMQLKQILYRGAN